MSWACVPRPSEFLSQSRPLLHEYDYVTWLMFIITNCIPIPSNCIRLQLRTKHIIDKRQHEIPSFQNNWTDCILPSYAKQNLYANDVYFLIDCVHRHFVLLWSRESQLCVRYVTSISQELSLQWRHNDNDSLSNHQPHGCLLNRLFKRISK